ncbi:MAG: nitroreductase family protein [Pseudomonadales bacterium]
MTHTPAFADVIQKRYSVRAFRPEPVPRTILDEVFGLANCAPSNCNTQPWSVHVASGEALDTLRNGPAADAKR